MDGFIVAVLAFAVCFLADKGFTKFFRSKAQHKSGLSVRLSKYFAVGGVLLFVLGVVGTFAGANQKDALLIVGSTLVMLVGVGLSLHYISFGIFYDEDTFVQSAFGARSITYRYEEIEGQQLYRSGRTVIIELHMKNGKTVDLQSTMTGAYVFLDAAFAGWCRQKGIEGEHCEFHDPDNSSWFPSVEGR